MSKVTNHSYKMLPEQDIKLRKITQKTRYRMQQICRMTLAGIPDPEIAIQLGYTQVQSINVIRMSPEYALIAQSIANHQLNELDLQAADTIKDIKEELKCRIPEALRVLYEALQDKKADVRLKAADKIFELDGRLGRKGEPGVVNQFNFNSLDTDIGDSIAESLRKVKEAHAGLKAAVKEEIKSGLGSFLAPVPADKLVFKDPEDPDKLVDAVESAEVAESD